MTMWWCPSEVRKGFVELSYAGREYDRSVLGLMEELSTINFVKRPAIGPLIAGWNQLNVTYM